MNALIAYAGILVDAWPIELIIIVMAGAIYSASMYRGQHRG